MRKIHNSGVGSPRSVVARCVNDTGACDFMFFNGTWSNDGVGIALLSEAGVSIPNCQKWRVSAESGIYVHQLCSQLYCVLTKTHSFRPKKSTHTWPRRIPSHDANYWFRYRWSRCNHTRKRQLGVNSWLQKIRFSASS